MSTVVTENQGTISFYITIISKEDQITIRLEPIADPEKTFGVKKSLALIAMKILEKENNLKITRTNLQDFITQ
jgi:hypothetical protein